MTKGQLNIAAAELQQKINRISDTHTKALGTAGQAVDRKYKKQIQTLLESKITNVNDGVLDDYVYPQEVVTRVEFPDFWNIIVAASLADSTVEDLTDDEAYLLPNEVKS